MKKILVALITLAGLILIAWKLLQLPVDIDKKPNILGHGGMGVASTQPLNSLGSIEEALAYPIQGSELDVRMTADEVLIAFHDNGLDQTTDCVGLISETNLIDLKNCSNSSWLKSEPITQLDGILGSDWAAGKTFSFDLKTDSEDGSERSIVFIEEVIFLIESYPELEFLIESQSIWVLTELQNQQVRAKLFYYAQDFERDLNLISENELDGISINMKLITADQVTAAQKTGIQVMLWGTGSVLSNKKVLKMGADIIQTDDIPSMVNLLDLK